LIEDRGDVIIVISNTTGLSKVDHIVGFVGFVGFVRFVVVWWYGGMVFVR